MSITVGAALKKIATAILSDPKVLKKLLFALLVLVVAMILPTVMVVSLFSGEFTVDTNKLEQYVVANLTTADVQRLQYIENMMDAKVENPDFQKAMPLLLTDANRGNGYACYDLGRMHQQGLGCEENEEEAQRWFSMALEAFRNAEQTAKKPGYLRYRIGKCYAYGHGAEQNYKESTHWFQRAVEENNPFAAYSLGGQYLRGQGVEQSNTEAYSLFNMAAEGGNAYAQYQLGRMCKDGIGTEVDLEESKLWYAKAYAGFLAMEETMADDKLYYRLGSMNMTGTGTEINLEQSEMYFQKAVELGNADALYGLGKLYLKVEFHGYDPAKAVAYLEQAVAKDHAYAKYQFKLIGMSP